MKDFKELQKELKESENKVKEIVDNGEDAYLSSLDNEVLLYDMEYNESIKLPRGTLIKLYQKDVEQKDSDGNVINTYKKIDYDNKLLIGCLFSSK